MKKGDLFPLASLQFKSNCRVQYIGIKRRPREYFISGAIPEGYLAPNDLSCVYPIGRLVQVKTETVVIETIIEEPHGKHNQKIPGSGIG